MERPILFSTPMVRAILEGRKTQTRRVIKEQVSTYTNAFGGIPKEHPPMVLHQGCWFKPDEYSPYGVVGDRLWVKETWQYYGWDEDGLPWIRYKADGKTKFIDFVDEPWDDRLTDIRCDLSAPENYDIDGAARDRRWRLSIFMPRWASRILLEITAIRVERVQDISRNDAIAEGVIPLGGLIDSEPWCASLKDQTPMKHPEMAYARLWNSINAKRGYSWESNLWVWVIEFKPVLAEEQ